jgi:hypothetical protein
LCEEDVSNFDPGQNIEQLDKVLISCREMCILFNMLEVIRLLYTCIYP